jgi:SAM-dependent methyltransferase
MHDSAMDKFQVFLRAYLGAYERVPLAVLDVGSCAIGGAETGTHRADIEQRGWTYMGVDIAAGPNVDRVLADGYDWREIDSDSVDVVLCSQVLEHTRYPWRVVQEIARVLRPRGLAFLAAPSAGHVHRYPEDCFRYYPDGLPALARAGGLDIVDANVQQRPVYRSNIWYDAVAVVQKPDLPPEQAGRWYGRRQLGGLSLRDDVQPDDLAAVSFAPRAADPSPIATIASKDGASAFDHRDAELARRRDPMRRILHVRRHLSATLKALTRPM